MADAFSWVIRFLHIVSGVMWVGGAFLWGMVIAPRVMQRGPPQIRLPFMETVLAPVSRYFNVAGAVTIVTGFWTLGLLAGWSGLVGAFQGDYAGAGYGAALGIGVVLAAAMALEGTLVIQPTARKLVAAMKTVQPGSPPPPEVPALGKKLGMASMLSLLLGMVALGAMAWAVNVVR